MNKIFSSASKVVFIIMAIAVIFALFTDKISGEQFMVLAGMTFTFYFSNKGSNNPTEPYLGK